MVLGGESAGSLCWHEGGTTDSFGSVRALPYGLGLLPYSNAVHYGDRRDLHQSCIAEGGLPDGSATDAGVGLYYQGRALVEAVADRPNAFAYWLERQENGTVSEDVIKPRRLKRS